MFIKLIIIIYLALLTSGCGTVKISHYKVYYRADVFPGIPVTTDKHPKDKLAIIITRDAATLQFRKDF